MALGNYQCVLMGASPPLYQALPPLNLDHCPGFSQPESLPSFDPHFSSSELSMGHLFCHSLFRIFWPATASKVHTSFPTRHVYTQPLSTHQLHAQSPSTCQVHAQPPSTCKALWPCPACSCLLSMLAPPSTPTPTSATCVCTRDRGLAK